MSVKKTSPALPEHPVPEEDRDHHKHSNERRPAKPGPAALLPGGPESDPFALTVDIQDYHDYGEDGKEHNETPDTFSKGLQRIFHNMLWYSLKG